MDEVKVVQDEKWALEKFGRWLKVACRRCGAKAGDLCVENPAVWVHVERMHDTEI